MSVEQYQDEEGRVGVRIRPHAAAESAAEENSSPDASGNESHVRFTFTANGKRVTHNWDNGVHSTGDGAERNSAPKRKKSKAKWYVLASGIVAAAIVGTQIGTFAIPAGFLAGLVGGTGGVVAHKFTRFWLGEKAVLGYGGVISMMIGLGTTVGLSQQTYKYFDNQRIKAESAANKNMAMRQDPALTATLQQLARQRSL